MVLKTKQYQENGVGVWLEACYTFILHMLLLCVSCLVALMVLVR